MAIKNYAEAVLALQGAPVGGPDGYREKVLEDGMILRSQDGGIGVYRPDATHPLVLYRADGRAILHTNSDLSVENRRLLMEYCPIEIESEQGVWIVTFAPPVGVNATKGIFVDGTFVMYLPNGEVAGLRGMPVYPNDLKAFAADRKRVGTFAGKIVHALRTGKLSKPGTGQCAHCALKLQVDGVAIPVGHVLKNKTHLTHHVQLMQYVQVPELLLTVLEQSAERDTFRPLLNTAWTRAAHEDLPAQDDGVWSLMAREVRRYLYRHLGYAYA